MGSKLQQYEGALSRCLIILAPGEALEAKEQSLLGSSEPKPRNEELEIEV